MLPTTHLTDKETLLQRVARSMTTWQRNAIAQLPTQILTPEMVETQQTSVDEAEQAYEIAFTIEAAELLYCCSIL
jgi:hypothetical protein